MNELLASTIALAGDTLGTLAGLALLPALGALVLQLANLVVRSLAWRNVLAAAHPDEVVPRREVAMAYAVGVGLNGWLPARGGEAAKVALARMHVPGSSVVSIAATSGVLLIFDLALGLVLLLGAWQLGFIGSLPVPSAASIAEVFVAYPLLATLGAVATLVVVVLGATRARPLVRRLGARLAEGGAVLRSPGRYLRTVACLQATGWACRVGVVYLLLLAFGLPGTLQLALLVIVLGGMSTAVPVPGGAGTQQMLVVPVLAATAGTAAALGFSIGMQVAVTVVNSSIAVLAAMLLFGRLHPVHAVRHALQAARDATTPVPGAAAPASQPEG